MFLIYQLIITILILISPIIIFFRILKNKEDFFRFKEKYSLPTKTRDKGKIVWFHGSSVGEIMSVVPLIYKYENKNSVKKILLTSSTLSSSKIVEKLKFKKVIHQFYPIDHVFFSNRFLNFWKPDLAIFLESEIWPSMFRSLKQKKIPLILLNARITKKTFRRWFKIKNFSQSIFSLVDIAYPQNDETSFFLKKLGIKNITQIGNLKYIKNDNSHYNKIEKKLFNQFKKFSVCVAASTHDSEEIFAARSHILLKRKKKNLITIIIPRHVDRVDEIINELKKFDLRITTHSSKKKNLKNIDIYIVDTFGESKKFYKIATTVFLGGSIIDKGGQNPIEPARFGAKILHGPNVGNFKEVYSFLNKLKISFKIKTPIEFANLTSFEKNKKKVNKIDYLGKKILNKTVKQLNKYI